MAIDHIEVSVGEVAYLGMHGNPVYTSLDDARRYSLLYGPTCYLPFEAGIALFGASIRSLKIAVVLLNFILFVYLWVAFRRFCSGWRVLVPLGFIAGGMTLDKMSPFLIRGDVTLAASVSLAILALSIKRREIALALFALGCASALDVKITAAFYLVIPFYLLARQRGFALASLATLITAVLTAAPFVLRQFSLGFYLAWLGEAAHHPLIAHLFLVNAATALIMLAPPLLILGSAYLQDRKEVVQLVRHNRVFIALFGMSLLSTIVAGSKLGAGPTHLNPWFITIAYIAVKLWHRLPAIQLSFLRRGLAICALVMIIPCASEASELFIRAQNERARAQNANLDLRGILQKYRGKSVGMSYQLPAASEDTQWLNSLSLQLVLAGNPLLVDEGALDDMQLSGITIPQSTVDEVTGCLIPVWLAVKEHTPFEVKNIYFAAEPARFSSGLLFDPSFRRAFSDNYQKTASSKFYDVWECKPRP